jgi:hypothetical protein
MGWVIASRVRPGLRLAVAVALSLAAAGLTAVNYRFSMQQPGGNDFLARWVGARAWVVEGISPYAPEVSLRAQELIYGRPAAPSRGEDVAHFVYPLPAMVFFGPFGWLPYTWARAVWMTVLEFGLVALAFLGVRLAGWQASHLQMTALVVFSVFGYPGARSIIVGQFAVIEAVLMTGGLLALRQGRDTWAGILLALAIAKPQMSVLLVLFVLLWGASCRRWRLVGTLVGAVGFLLIASTALLPSWWGDWIRQVGEYPSYTALGSPISILAGLLTPGSSALSLMLTASLAGVLAWVGYRSLGQDIHALIWGAALTIVITNLIMVRTATTNYVILVPVLCVLFAQWIRRRPAGGPVGILATLLVLGLGLWTLFLLTVDGNREHPVMYLPMPLLTLAGAVLAGLDRGAAADAPASGPEARNGLQG